MNGGPLICNTYISWFSETAAVRLVSASRMLGRPRSRKKQQTSHRSRSLAFQQWTGCPPPACISPLPTDGLDLCLCLLTIDAPMNGRQRYILGHIIFIVYLRSDATLPTCPLLPVSRGVIYCIENTHSVAFAIPDHKLHSKLSYAVSADRPRH